MKFPGPFRGAPTSAQDRVRSPSLEAGASGQRSPGRDAELHALLSSDPERGWRAFIDEQTPTLLAQIERVGIRDHDDAMDVYLMVCERLSSNECARLRDRDRTKGSLAAWLAVVVRHVVVDWIRSRKGRRRLFAPVRRLDELHRRVFELYYWEGRHLSEVVEELRVAVDRRIGIPEVLTLLQEIDGVLTQRHRSELLSYVARSRSDVSLEDVSLEESYEMRDERLHPEREIRQRELEASFSRALRKLSPEEAAIVRLRYEQGLSLRDVGRALHLPDLDGKRLAEILGRLRAALDPGTTSGARSP